MTPRARIAIFVYNLAATGVVRNAHRLADALAEDHEVELIAQRGGVMTGSRPVTLLGDPARLGLTELTRSALRLRRHLSRHPPAVAISAGMRGHAQLVAATAGRRGPKRIFRISNDIDHAGTRRGLAAVANRLQTAAVIAAADRLVLVSRHLLDDPRLARAADQGRVTIIENGVDIARARARAAEPLDTAIALPPAPFVLAVGSLYPQKNYPLLIDAVAVANRTRPLHLVILGQGSDAARAALLDRAASAGIGDRMWLPGFAANPFAAMARAAVFALPSLWEGASNALLEALAVGTPVVASPMAGNAAAVIGDGHYGLLADPRDADDWAAALLRQAGPEPVRPGDRAAAYGLANGLAAWRALVAEVLAEPSSRSR